MKHPLVWIGTFVTAVVTSVTGTLIATGSQRAANTPAPKGPAVLVGGVLLQSDVELKGNSFAFAQSVDLTPDRLKQVNEQSFDIGAWARSQGGVDTYMVMAQMVVVGNRRDSIRILGMRAINQCGAPLTGTLFDSPAAGEDNSVRIAFNLDEQNPQAQEWTGRSSGFGTNYFNTKTILLNYKEQQTLQIIGITKKHYCEFQLQLTVFAAGKTVTQSVLNDTQPFRVTAFADSLTSEHPFSDYQRAYAGGVDNPGKGGKFVRVNPATYRFDR